MSTDELDRAARASRGKRMSKLLDEEAEADDDFWNQDAFRDDAEDNEYATEDEEADVFDSDFDEVEEADDEEFAEEDERPSKKRKLPPGHQQHEKKKDKKKKKEKKEKKLKKKEKKEKHEKTKESSSLERRDSFPFLEQGTPLPVRTPATASQASQLHENGETAQDVDGERSIRKSTRTAVVIKQAEREAHQAALQALSRPAKKKKEEERKISQEEMLLEAAQTEIQNMQALEVMLAREEEVKRKATIQKALYAGPQIRFHSRDGKNIVEFTKATDFPPILNSSPSPYPKKVLCVVTGLPAKYRDPKTGLPYATKEAFRAIREKFNKRENSRGGKNPLEESHQRKRTKVERERSGTGGRRSVTQHKYKKVISMIVGHDDAAAPEPTEPEPDEVLLQQNAEPSMEQPDVEDSVVDLNFGSALIAASKNGMDSLQLSSRNLMAHDLSSLDMPEAFVETNEADFMLDDIELAQPSVVE